MAVLEQEFVKGFIRLCNDGFLQGWHERNGGNLTYRMKKEEVEAVKDEPVSYTHLTLPTTYTV